MDYDVVELSNLHRQILHRESSLGTSKAKSLARSIQDLNSSVRMTIHDVQLDRSNALSIISGYDVILDCSDNPATRYLINDASVLAGRPLVSGSALRWEGQLTIYNYKGGPCYRCLYPSPPDPKYVTNCSDGGVIGAGIKKKNPFLLVAHVHIYRSLYGILMKLGYTFFFVDIIMILYFLLYSTRLDWDASGHRDHQIALDGQE